MVLGLLRSLAWHVASPPPSSSWTFPIRRRDCRDKGAERRPFFIFFIRLEFPFFFFFDQRGRFRVQSREYGGNTRNKKYRGFAVVRGFAGRWRRRDSRDSRVQDNAGPRTYCTTDWILLNAITYDISAWLGDGWKNRWNKLYSRWKSRIVRVIIT